MITDLEKLAKRLQINFLTQMVDELFSDFPLKVPASFVKRMRKHDPNDPLLLQVMPQMREQEHIAGFAADPISEKKSSPITGLIHKYQGRVLLLANDACPLNCRFCFRRHAREKVQDWQKVFSYINSDASISEVILSGGDPLMLTPAKLQTIFTNLEAIAHLRRLRIHSRLPIVKPEAITSELAQLLGGLQLPTVLVVHCNHPNEVNEGVAMAASLLHRAGVHLFNQSVLLRGINDNAITLSALSEKLFAIGIVPYYLHMLDRVQGAAHFYVEESQAKKIYAKMQEQLPGYLVPKLVIEVPGLPTKKNLV